RPCAPIDFQFHSTSWHARPQGVLARVPLFAVMGSAGQGERDAGVDGEVGGAPCGSTSPRASLCGALPGVALLLSEREFLLEIGRLLRFDDGLFLRGGELDLALLTG